MPPRLPRKTINNGSIKDVSAVEIASISFVPEIGHFPSMVSSDGRASPARETIRRSMGGEGKSISSTSRPEVVAFFDVFAPDLMWSSITCPGLLRRTRSSTLESGTPLADELGERLRGETRHGNLLPGPEHRQLQFPTVGQLLPARRSAESSDPDNQRTNSDHEEDHSLRTKSENVIRNWVGAGSLRRNLKISPKMGTNADNKEMSWIANACK